MKGYIGDVACFPRITGDGPLTAAPTDGWGLGQEPAPSLLVIGSICSGGA
jgi:hypothetical protein